MVGHGKHFRWLIGWHARHAGGSGDRVERKHGHQEPNQKCRERTVHRLDEYSIPFSVSNSFKPGQSEAADRYVGLHVVSTCGTAQQGRADWDDDRARTRGATAARNLDNEEELKMKKIQSRIVCAARQPHARIRRCGKYARAK